MSELNERQMELVRTTKGLIVVDAGPGTGKTETIVNRYVSIILNEEVGPERILMLTFTNNAADELKQRVEDKMLTLRYRGDDPDLIDKRRSAMRQLTGSEEISEQQRALLDVKRIKVSTFDSMCYSIVADNAEDVGKFFEFEETLTRSATIVSNETVNRQYFRRFFDGFLENKGADYGDVALVAATRYRDVMAIIDNLMSKGICPVKDYWFGYGAEKALYGDMEETLRRIDIDKNDYKKKEFGSDSPAEPSHDDVMEAVSEDREMLMRFIHDVYLDYIRCNIRDNRLTFGLNALFAFILLYANERVRKGNRFDHMIIDEFQDTNANQLMTSLMSMEQANLCAVGDWKQGIYGFRYVSIENILRFEERLTELRAFLNDDVRIGRVQFSIEGTHRIVFDKNYRSSQEILDKAYDCMSAKATDDDRIEDDIEKKISRIRADNGYYKDFTGGIRVVQCASKEDEPKAVVKAVKDYVWSGNYTIYDEFAKAERNLLLDDIAVFCHTTKQCRMVKRALDEARIPAFMQGDAEIMNTREGKLALAWLKYVNNDRDPHGYIPVLADEGYSMAELQAVKRDIKLIPDYIVDQREILFRKKRRITDLLTTLFEFYSDLDDDIVQAIISEVSSSHRKSLITIADVISLIEEDIESNSRYNLENSIDKGAVTVMTMHKSKGLQFGAVIVPFIDAGSMPRTSNWHIGDAPSFWYNEVTGIRMSKCVEHKDYERIVESWRGYIVKTAAKKDYNEDRRLMFVTASRARLYETFICNGDGSKFMETIGDGIDPSEIEDVPIEEGQTDENVPEVPEVGAFEPRRIKLGVHDIMDLEFTRGSNDEISDEIGSRGVRFGKKIHNDAYLIAKGRQPDFHEPEHDRIREIVDSLKGSEKLLPEVDCVLPLEGQRVSLKGVIDLLAIRDGTAVVHDYKTDSERSDKIDRQYMVQLSVYAHAAMKARNLNKAVCQLDFVSRGETLTFDPLPIEEIEAIVAKKLNI